MKTKITEKAEKTIVQQLREVRDKINMDIKDMSLEQLKTYLKKQKTLHPTSFWQ